MTIASEFTFLHFGKEIVILHNCILDPPTNLLTSNDAFAIEIQKPSIASHGMDLSILCCCQDTALTGI